MVSAIPKCDVPNPPPICDRNGGDNPPPKNHNPFGAVDDIVRQPGQVRVRGWVIDPDITVSIEAV
jgi:hypothetical protein